MIGDNVKCYCNVILFKVWTSVTKASIWHWQREGIVKTLSASLLVTPGL